MLLAEIAFDTAENELCVCPLSVGRFPQVDEKYSQGQVDKMMTNKADSADVYTKAEVYKKDESFVRDSLDVTADLVDLGDKILEKLRQNPNLTHLKVNLSTGQHFSRVEQKHTNHAAND